MSSHCHDEHDHGHGGHSHEGHDHSDDITPALQYSLYQHINFDDVTTLNEAVSDSGKAIVKKTWAERMNDEPELESDADEQLLMHIPFVYPAIYPSKRMSIANIYIPTPQIHRPSKTSLHSPPHIEL